MFPFTIIAIVGVGLTKRVVELLTFWEASKKSKKMSLRRKSNISNASIGSKNNPDIQNNVTFSEDDQEEELEEEGFTKIQKGSLGFVWGGSIIYSCITDKILSKEQTDEVICSVREDLSINYNIISVLMVVAFPILCLILWPIGHFLLDLLSCVKGIIILSTRKQVSLMSDEEATCCGDESDSCIETILIFGFTTIFLVVYPTSMLITEFYFGDIETMFPFMLLKYCLGSMGLVLPPICVLVIKRDIRKAAKDIYNKKTVKHEDTQDISLKELVERLEQLRTSGNVSIWKVRYIFDWKAKVSS